MVRKETLLGDIHLRETSVSELSVGSTTSLYLGLLWTRFPKHLLVNKSRNLQGANKGQTNHSGLSNVIENQYTFGYFSISSGVYSISLLGRGAGASSLVKIFSA